MRTCLAALLFLAPLLPAEEAPPPHAVARLGAPRFHNPDGVGSGAVSPDGRLVAFSSLEGGVRVWQAESGDLAWASDVPAACADVVAFDESGERLYGVRLGEARVSSWDAKSGAPLTGDALPELSTTEGVLAASAGRLAIAAVTGSVLLLDLATRRTLWGRTWLGRDYECVALSPDGTRVAVADGEGDLLLLGPDGRETWRDESDELARTALAFSADGARLVVGNELGGVQVFDAATGAAGASMAGEETWILSIAVSPDGSQVAAASEDGFVQAWSTVDGKKAWGVRFIPDPIFVLAFSPDGKTLVVASEIGAVRYLDPATGKDRTPGEGHLDPVVALAFSPDGRELLSGGVGGGVIVWDLATSSPRWRKADGRYGVLSVAWDAKGAAVWVTDGAAIHRCGGAPSRHSWRRIEDHERLRAATLTADGSRVFAVTDSSSVGVWEAATSKLLWEARESGPERCSTATTPLGERLVLAWGAQALLYVQGVGPVSVPIELHGQTYPVAISPDGRYLAAAASAEGVGVYEIVSGVRCAHIGKGPQAPTSLCFGADSRLLAVGRHGGEVELCDLAGRFPTSTLKGHQGRVTALAFSLDGRRLASGGSDKTIYVWDVAGVANAPRGPGDLEACWEGLSSASDACTGVWGLVDAGDEAVGLIAERLAPAKVDDGAIARLLAQLDADDFEEREAASAALADHGTDAEPALAAVLASSPSAEVRVRAGQLLTSMGGVRLAAPEALRGVRAVAVLESIDTPAAREALSRLASGAPQSRLTREAQAALSRLAK